MSLETSIRDEIPYDVILSVRGEVRVVRNDDHEVLVESELPYTEARANDIIEAIFDCIAPYTDLLEAEMVDYELDSDGNISFFVDV